MIQILYAVYFIIACFYQKKIDFIFRKILRIQSKQTNMSTPLLTEPHNFTRGDTVIVVDRTSTYLSYVGQIYAIVNKPENEYMKPTRLIDYFYIQFPEPIYHELLKRGFEILYRNRPVIIGTIHRNPTTNCIEKLYTQEKYCAVELEIDIKDINAMLVWRIAFDIQPAKIVAKL